MKEIQKDIYVKCLNENILSGRDYLLIHIAYCSNYCCILFHLISQWVAAREVEVGQFIWIYFNIYGTYICM